MAAKIILVKRIASPLRKGAPMGNQNARKDGGGMTISKSALTECHVSKGYLLVFDSWRKKRLRQRSDAVKRPPEAHAQDAMPPTVSSLSPTSPKKSSEKKAEE
ncbi:MAG: hypothetical protein Ta2A_11930 [Treponemataceae bacterium]|nr:MAG: hypothetical protein Ta2A_11930 [Treponemataceae bacterium]